MDTDTPILPRSTSPSDVLYYEAVVMGTRDDAIETTANSNRSRRQTDLTILVVPDQDDFNNNNNSDNDGDEVRQDSQVVVSRNDSSTAERESGSIYIDLTSFTGRIRIDDRRVWQEESTLQYHHQQQLQDLQTQRLIALTPTRRIPQAPPISSFQAESEQLPSSMHRPLDVNDGEGDDDNSNDGSNENDNNMLSLSINLTRSIARHRVDDDWQGRDEESGSNDGSCTDNNGGDDENDQDLEDDEDNLIGNRSRIPDTPGSTDITQRMSFVYLMRLQAGSNSNGADLPHDHQQQLPHLNPSNVTQTPSSASLTTPMHQLVASSEDLTVSALQELLDRDRDLVRVRDSDGRLPLHVLGNNCQLLSSFEGQIIAKQCVMMLIEAFPDSIVKTDNSDRMPFTTVIFGWVCWSHLRMELTSDLTGSGRGERGDVGDHGRMTGAEPETSSEAGPTLMTGTLQALATKLKEWERQAARFGSSSEATSAQKELREEFEKSAKASLALSQSSNKFPPIIIFEQVEWSFRMLSLAMDYLAGNTFDVTKRGRPALSYRKQRLNRDRLAQNLVSIPQLFKTVLLLESREVREEITNSSAFRRAMFCKGSVGPWLTSMLRSKKGNSAEMALQYLESINELSIDDFVGSFRTPLPRDEFLFQQSKIALYDYIDEVNDVIPSLLVLKEDLLNRAVALPLIWRLMNRRITTPFTVSLTVTDFLLHITLILVVRDLSFQTYDVESAWFGGTAVVIFIAAYQILRRAMEIFVLARISKRVAKRYFFNFYNILDFFGVVGALITVGLGADFSVPVVPAIILGLLWFRILGFLKVVNEQLATFIESLKKICYDIRFFLVVFLILIFTFGDMFHSIYLSSSSIDCDELQDDVSQDFCADNSMYSYLRVYAIILGDFELSNFQLSDGITFLFVLVTLLGTIILLNVLIAVVTNSYEKSIGTSAIIFRKSRAEFVVSHVAAKRFLQPRKEEQKDNASTRTSNNNLEHAEDQQIPSTEITSRAKEAVKQVVFIWFLRWVIAISFLFTITISALYMIEQIIYAAQNEEPTIIFLLFVGLIAFLLAYTVWATIIFIASVLFQGFGCSSMCRFFNSVNDTIIKHTASFMFGIDATNLDKGGAIPVDENRSSEELINRMDKMESILERALEKIQEERGVRTLDGSQIDTVS